MLSLPSFRYVSFEKNFYEVVREMKPEFESLVYCGGLGFEHESTAIFQRELQWVITLGEDGSVQTKH